MIDQQVSKARVSIVSHDMEHCNVPKEDYRPSHRIEILLLVEAYCEYAGGPHSIPGHEKTNLKTFPGRKIFQMTQP